MELLARKETTRIVVEGVSCQLEVVNYDLFEDLVISFVEGVDLGLRLCYTLSIVPTDFN